jgi:uncharacterized damage-inducible protein DinB
MFVESYAVNERMNQLLLEHLDRRAWQAKPSNGKGRTIAAIFAHVHNIRRKWVRLSAPHLRLATRLDRRRLKIEQARAALAESAARVTEMLAEAREGPEGRVKVFHRDGWARPWPPGTARFTYMVSHEAHHRPRSRCWRISLAFLCQSRPRTGFGLGRSCGRSAGLLTCGESPVARRRSFDRCH